MPVIAAALAASVLEKLGVDRAAIYGWSAGGHVAIEMMGSFPELVAGVIISGTPPIEPGPMATLRAFQPRLNVLRATLERFSERDAERFERLALGRAAGSGFLPAIRRTDGRFRTMIKRSLLRGDGVNQKLTVEQSPIPLAVMHGVEDAIPRLAYIAGLPYANLWGGQVHVIPDAGHAPFLEAPDVFNGLVLRFLNDAAASPRLDEAWHDRIALTA
jgi:pimeloyl-ACP methyl ester carboxylesterase